MKVRATMLGFYGMERRKEGVTFEIEDLKEFSHEWMEAVDFKPPPKRAIRNSEYDTRPTAKPKATEKKPDPKPEPEPELVDQNSDVI